MCGIGGWIIKGPITDNVLVTQVLTDMMLRLQSRGKDAAGIYTSLGDGIVNKAPGPAYKFQGYPEAYGQATFIHTRAATQGSPADNNNNHPIVSDSYVMVHNGILHMKRLNGYPYRGEVDSEVLLSYIEAMGMQEALQKLQGSAAIALCKRKEPDKVWLFTDSWSLTTAYIPGHGLLFASTRETLQEVIRKYFRKWMGVFTPASFEDVHSNELWEVDLPTMTVKKEMIKNNRKYWNGSTPTSYCGSTRIVIGDDEEEGSCTLVPAGEKRTSDYPELQPCQFCNTVQYVRLHKNKLWICRNCDLLLGEEKTLESEEETKQASET